jgi:hypothetical protein
VVFISYISIKAHMKTVRRRDPDWVYHSGIAVILLHIGVVAIPGALHADWTNLVLVAVGIIL